MTSATYIDRAHHSRTSSLESLPSEIKVMILCHMPGLSCLRNIVHASPAYHEAYLGAREEVLHIITTHVLHQNDIHLLNPWTAVHAAQLGYYIHNCAEIMTECLERYAQGRMDCNPRRLAVQDSLAILNLQGKIAFLISEYCKAMFAKNPLTESKDKDSLPPSQSELNRLYRAFWRYEIYSKLFGPSKGCRQYVIGVEAPEFSEVEIAHKVFGLFPIHEIEELACLHRYAETFYRMEYKGNEHDKLVALGPKRLYKVMTAKSEKEHDARINESSMYGRLDVTVRIALYTYERDVGWGSSQWKGIHDKFVSDRVPTTGWLWASSRGIQNVDFRLRRWGYVFWDRERLDNWNIMEKDMVNFQCWRFFSP